MAAIGGPELVVCTPLRVEHWATARGLRSAAGAVRVVRTGMGLARSLDHIALAGGEGPVAIVGVAGGLLPEVRSGDVVVASTVATTGGLSRECNGVDLLASSLRAAGLSVRVGPLVSAPKVVADSARGDVAATYGAIAIDMESGYLATALASGRPVAVVRVIVDAPGQPLLSPAIVTRGWQGLQILRQAVAVLPEWAEAVTSAAATERTT